MRSAARWTLTQGALDGLLERLDSDRERAGEKYEDLRARLIKFFHWRGSTSPEDDADEALDRLTRRLTEGERIDHPQRYVYGVARMVLFESLRRQERRAGALSAAVADRAAPGEERPDEGERQTRCLDECLAALAPSERELILEYYRGEGAARIERRQALAGRLGIPAGLLRFRAHRIRVKLETCLCRCLGRQPRAPAGDREAKREAGMPLDLT